MGNISNVLIIECGVVIKTQKIIHSLLNMYL